MASRIELHETLKTILGSNNVYFNPPEKLKMEYPCIRYKRTTVRTENADDKIYLKYNRYQIVVIDKNVDSQIADRILEQLPLTTISNFTISEGLLHVFMETYY